MYEFSTHGVCASKIFFNVENGKVHNVAFEGGCNGNLKAIGVLVEGMDAKEAAQKLKGIQCGRKPTSCGDQLSRALEEALQKAE
ncbi:MAG: TIGR03905 family TSCPD domain-containing protein [Spirochaetaceae bacterium]|jgi:uncharacterized protein (TIGR03905 family)|nr:TIGR03905 family TSCPD domain-containing protein [Spirochaetaceae bacterium]